MIVRIIEILFPVFALTLAGFWIGRIKKPDLRGANQLNMDVFIPALVFSVLAGQSFDIHKYSTLLLLTLTLVLCFGLLAWGFARLRKIPLTIFVPSMMFNNCGNLGLPLSVLAFGEQALAPAVVMFLVSNLMHFSFGAWLLDHKIRWWMIWQVPVVSATFAGLAVSMMQLMIWPPLMLSIRMLGEISIPLMLFALGVRLTESPIRQLGIGLLGAVFRPVSGLILAWILLQFFDLPKMQQSLVLVFGALPPAVLNYLFAERYEQHPEAVASMVLLGNLVSPLFLALALSLAL